MRKTLVVSVASLVIAVTSVAQIPYERAVSSAVYGAAAGDQIQPAVASNGKDFLAVWADLGRNGIYAAGIGADGTLFDETDLRVAGFHAGGGALPYVFWSGDAYVVFWLELSPYTLYAARLDTERGTIDPPRAVLNGFVTSIAMNGSRFVVAYDRQLAVLDINARLIERDIALPGLTPQWGYVTLASNGNAFLAGWMGETQLMVAALDRSGHPAGAAQALTMAASGTPRLASNGSDYLLLAPGGTPSQSWAQRLSAQGQPLDPAVNVAAPAGGLRSSGSNYLLTWATSRADGGPYEIDALRLDSKGAAQDTSPLVLASVSGPMLLPMSNDLTVNGTTALLAWVQPDARGARTFGHDIAARTFDVNTLVSSTPVLVTRAAVQQTSPHIAFGGRNSLVVWEESGVIYAGRVTPDGRPLDGRGVRLSSDTALQTLPDVVFDGNAYVVGWESIGTATTTLKLNRISPDSGALLNADAASIAASCGTFPYDLATDGALTMVAYGDCHNAAVRVQRVNRSLLPLDVAQTITPAQMSVSQPSVAWTGNQWLVAFEEVVPVTWPFEPPTGLESYGNIRALRLTPSLTRLDTEPLAIAVSADSPEQRSDQRRPQVASSGDDYLVTWTRKEWGGSGAAEVRARHVFPKGAIEGNAADAGLYVAPGTGSSTIWTGTLFAIGYSSPSHDALGATIGKGLGAIASGYFKIANGPDDEAAPSLVAVSGRVTAAYVRTATEPVYGGVGRIFVRDTRPIHGRVAVR